MNFSEVFTLPLQESWNTYAGSVFNLQRKDWVPSISLENVDVLGDSSIICSKEEELVEAVVDEALYWNPRPFPFEYLQNSDLVKALIDERKANLSGIKHRYYKHFGHNKILHSGYFGIYLCHPFGFYAYGHLHDSLQRLFSVRHLLQDRKYRIVVSRYDRISDFVDHLGALIGRNLDQEEIIHINEKEIHSFDQLIVPFSPAIPTSFTPETYDWMFNGYVNKFVHETLKPPSRNLYLSRKHVTPGSRSVINEGQIRELLENRDFTVVYGDEPLEEIVNLFYGAKTVVGCHGSLFANTMFCRPEAQIVEYCPANRIDYSFMNKYKYAQKYHHQLVEADERFNILIPAEDLLGRLA